MVGGARDRCPGQRQALDGARELLARRVEQREVEEPGVAAGGPCARILVQHDELLVAGAERGDGILAAVQPSPRLSW